MLDYQLIRSKKRKTLGLQVKHGLVIVRAPYYVTSSFIDAFIQEKSAWLHSKITEQKQHSAFCDFSHASNIFLLGEHLTLDISVGKFPEIHINNSLVDESESDALFINGDNLERSFVEATRQLNVVISERIHKRLSTDDAKALQVKKQLEVYFKEQAELLFAERIEAISTQTELYPKSVNIRQYRARWGSCNNRGEVSLNYLLMMTPPFVIDYVIVHELCHLVHLNHSKAFWLLVESHCPKYKEAKHWLKSHQSKLTWLKPC